MSSSVTSNGLGCSVLASLLFGLTPWYVQLLSSLDGSLIFWNRVIFSAITALIFLLLLKRFHLLIILLKKPKDVMWLTVGTVLVGLEWWLFVWAPLNEFTTDLSQGYFLLPLTLVLTGRVLYGEKLRPLQIVATCLAALGVMHEIIQFGSLSWVSIVVAAGYPMYIVIRKKVKASSLACYFFENMLLLFVAVFAILSHESFFQTLAVDKSLHYLLPGLGILCTGAMLLYISASKVLPVSLFGLLSYLEPAIIFLVAIFILEEPLTTSQWVTYGFIWLATAIICIDSIRIIRKPAIA